MQEIRTMSEVHIVRAVPTVEKRDAVPAQLCVRLDLALREELAAYRTQLTADDPDLTIAAIVRRLLRRALKSERSK
jgi:hypothetical protein